MNTAPRWDTDYLAQDVFEREMNVHRGTNCGFGFGLLMVGERHKIDRIIATANNLYLRIHNTEVNNMH